MLQKNSKACACFVIVHNYTCPMYLTRENRLPGLTGIFFSLTGKAITRITRTGVGQEIIPSNVPRVLLAAWEGCY